VLQAGGVIAYPTEAVYGIGCLPLAADGVLRVLAIKGRDLGKGLIVVAADLAQLDDLVALPSGPLRADILASWPGPTTWVLPTRSRLPPWLTGGRPTLAVRVSAHPIVAALCRRAGSPLISTSANLSGRPPARSALAVRGRLGRELDFVLAGPLGGGARPTEIRDGATGAVLRAG
jgi:L-threonylcarbamoyladenylate synthase